MKYKIVIYDIPSLSRKQSRNLLGAEASMSHGHILLSFQVVALLTIYSDKYPYQITISYPYILHSMYNPLFFFLSVSLSFYLQNLPVATFLL